MKLVAVRCKGPIAGRWMVLDENKQPFFYGPQSTCETLVNRWNGYEDLLSMLGWLVGFHQPGDPKAVIDAEPINQARALIERLTKQNPSSSITL